MRKNLATVALTAGAFLLVLFLVFHQHQASKEKILSQFYENDLLTTQDVARSIERYFRSRSMDLQWLAYIASRQDFNKVAAAIRSNFNRLKMTNVQEVALLNEKGIVVYSTTAGAKGENHSQADFFSWAGNPGNNGAVRMWYGKTEGPRIPVTAGSLAPPHIGIFLATPLYREAAGGGRQNPGGKFAGVLMFTVDLEKVLAERSPSLTPLDKLHKFWVMERDGTLLMHSANPQMVMRNIRKRDETCNQCHVSFDYVETILRKAEGSTEYQTKGEPRKVATFTSMTFGKTSWILVMNMPLDEVTAFESGHLKDTLFLLGTVVFLLGLAFFSAYRSYRQKVAGEMEVQRMRENQKLMEKLRETHDYLESLFNYANAPIIVWNPETRITRFNHAFEHLSGYTADEVIGQKLNLLFPESDRKKALSRIASTLSGEYWESVEIPILHKDGDLRIALWNSANIYAEDGVTVISTIAQGQDITERKQSETKLLMSEKKYRQHFENASDVIYSFDREFRVLSISPSVERITGYKPEEVIGKTFPELNILSPKDLEKAFSGTMRVFAGEHLDAGTYEFIARDGKRKYGEVSSTPLFRGGQVVAVNCIARDITERKRAEEEKAKLEAQLQQAQKMESVGRLAGGVAHDFNNMLGVILGHTEMALDQVNPAQPLHADLEEILKAANHSADLTRQLLAFARKQTVAPKVLDLNETVEGMLKMLRRIIGEDINLAWLPGAGLWRVKVDPSQIDQMLANLCVNARDAISGVGKMTIETGISTFDEDYCSVHVGFVPGDYVLLAVSDNGCGMDKETLSHLFEPFFTTKGMGKGTGLGLATVYGIVKQNNGFINVYSEPGQGTTFKIYLPRHVGKGEQARMEGVPGPALRGQEIVLLAEDEPALLEITTMMLERQGYTVLVASTPGEAIRLAREYTGQIHLLLTDVVMPEMNGRDLAKNLLALYPHLKRLFMSGYTVNVIAHHGVLDEGVYFIQKPFSIKELAAKVREALDSE